jgi:hypothetical protein
MLWNQVLLQQINQKKALSGMINTDLGKLDLACDKMGQNKSLLQLNNMYTHA